MHFSPRPNKAHEIGWQPWGPQAFALAQAENKPILLSISAVWCHWCHVMDETTYSDPMVIGKIKSAYIPVRVDNDHRPDVNARYNQGGWPTTAFLTPDGSLLAGATYMPPAQMRGALDQVLEFYRTNREQIEERTLQLRSQMHEAQQPAENGLEAGAIDQVLQQIESQFDEEFGGFGTEPKFPMTGVLELLLREWQITGNQRLYDMLARTMLAMGGGGMYDHVEGGFFRYSTTRDWSVPHFEKMAEDHGALLRILAGLVQRTDNPQFRSTLYSASAYVRDVLRDPRSGLFAGSQDADEHYYTLPLDERKKLEAPYIDRTSYTNWSAGLAAAFFAAGAALEDDSLVQYAAQSLDTIEGLRDPDGLLFHVLEPGKPAQVRGLLTDHAAYLSALIDAHEFTGEARFFERALATARRVMQTFGAPGGGFYDHAALEDVLGALEVRQRPLPENASVADSFARLSLMANDPGLEQTARGALQHYASTFDRMGMFAAPYASAVRRFVTGPVTLVLTGTPQETAPLREAARNLPEPLMTIRTRPAQSGEASGAAYLCAGTACAPPATGAPQLRSAYELLRTNTFQNQTP